jgi:hypothetical protein
MKKFLLFLIIINRSLVLISDDSYKKNYLIDVLNYTYRISVSDTSDMISGDATITLIFKGSPSMLEFDLKNTGADGKGMVVDSVGFSICNADW